MSDASNPSKSDRLLDAAAELLRQGGVAALSTRAVAAAAGTQPPVLYRRFGDKDGLLEAVALHLVQDYIGKMRKLVEKSDDPIEDLRRLWDLYVDFAFTHPECLTLIYGHTRRGEAISAAGETMKNMVHDAIIRSADHGRLRMSVERATMLFRSCGVGFVLTQVRIPAEMRDPELSAIARENVLSRIAVTSGTGMARTTLTAQAAALRQAILNEDVPLSDAEHELIVEWLDRIADKH
jgi:AcrR family transcriptional regulator